MTENTTADVFGAVNQATDQVREFGERATGNTRALGQQVLDTYERGVTVLVEFERKAADAAQIDWVRTAVERHAAFVQDVNGAYLKAARAALV